MCLNAKASVRKSVVEQLKKQGFIVGYKKVVKTFRYIGKKKVDVMQSICFSTVWEKGWNYSDIHVNGSNGRKTFDANSPKIRRAGSSKVSAGIHVFLKRPKLGAWDRGIYKILPVMCFEQDFIAAGIDNNRIGVETAVFSKVFVRNDYFDKALPPKNKK